MAAPSWHILGFQEVLQQLGNQPEGLTEEEVSERLIQSGPATGNGNGEIRYQCQH